MSLTVTDLHAHILPAFDDGAEDMETALQMLREAKAGGVDRLALTSHFYPQREEFSCYIERRQAAFEALTSRWDHDTMPQLKLGAEVRYTPALVQMDLRQLTIGESDYMLLELPTDFVPAHVEHVVQDILDMGITPILAHVERCYYFRKSPERLLELIHLGALAQVSARALRDRRDSGFSMACLRNGLAHVIASDAHGLLNGSPCLSRLVADMNEDVVARAEEFACAIWNNKCPPAFYIASVKKSMFGYR